MILYVCADLLWATKIKSTAEAIGINARPVRSVEMLEARLEDSDPRALLVDLDAGEIALKLLHRLRRDADSPEQRAIRVLAFGPHVATELFEQARDAGADRAIARGGLADRLPEILRDLDRDRTES